MSTEKEKEDETPNFTWGGPVIFLVLAIYYFVLFWFGLEDTGTGGV